MLTAVKQRLRSLGASIPRGPRSSTRESKFGLTARESEVVRFAQLGWTNNEIADRLFLSARTVEHHLSSIYDKMGIRSKREVGDRLRETSDQRILQGNIA
jgi:DNA-binding NarL/FixJ family response regulator